MPPKKRDSKKVMPTSRPHGDDEEDGERRSGGTDVTDGGRIIQQPSGEIGHGMMGAEDVHVPREETGAPGHADFPGFSADALWGHPLPWMTPYFDPDVDLESDGSNEDLQGFAHGFEGEAAAAVTTPSDRTEEEDDLALALEMQLNIYADERGNTPMPSYEAAAAAVSLAADDGEDYNAEAAGHKDNVNKHTLNNDPSKRPAQKKRSLPPIPKNARPGGLVIHRKMQDNKAREKMQREQQERERQEQERQEREQQETLDRQLAAQLESEENERPARGDPMAYLMEAMMHRETRHAAEHHYPGIHLEDHVMHPSPRRMRLARLPLHGMGRRGAAHNMLHLLVGGGGRIAVLRSPGGADDVPDADDYEALLAFEERQGEVKKRGLSEEDFERLPISEYKAEQEGSGDTVCKVCLDDITEKQKLRTLPCCHFFHVQCIDDWLKINGVCPVCRLVVKDQLHV